MAVADRAVVRAPMVHHIIGCRKRASGPAVTAGREPGAGPGVISPFPEHIRHLVGQVHGPAFGDLQHRPQAANQIQPDHGRRHHGSCQETGGESAAAEIAIVRRVPGGRRQNRLLVFFGYIPPFLHDAVAIRVFRLAAGVQAGRAGIDQMDQAAVLFRRAFQLIPRGALHGLRAPEGAHVGEDLCAVRQKLHKEHPQTVQHVVLGRQDIRLPRPVPVERSVQKRLREVCVGIEIGPLALALETGRDRVVADGFLGELRIELVAAAHQLLDDNHHFHHKLPVLLLLLRRPADEFRVLVESFLAVRLRPGQGALILVMVVDALGHAADDLHLIHGLHAHPQPGLNEIAVDDRTADAHADRPDLQIGFPAHRRHGHRRAPEPQQLLFHIFRDRSVVRVADLMAVDAECRKPLLRVGRQHRRQIDRTRALRAVETPDRLDRAAVHIHRLRAVAPARGHGQGDRHALFLKFRLAGRRLAHAPDRRIRNHDFHRFAVAVPQILLEQFRGRPGHVHRLVLQIPADIQRPSPSVNRRADPDHRIFADQSVPSHV